MSGHHHFTSQHRQQSKKNLIFVVNRIYPHPKLQISVYFIEKYFRFSTENTYIELRSADTESVICNVQWPVLWSVSSPTCHQSSWHWRNLWLVCKEMFSSLIGHLLTLIWRKKYWVTSIIDQNPGFGDKPITQIFFSIYILFEPLSRKYFQPDCFR